MKRLIATFACCSFLLSLNAQDTIVLRNDTKISAKIVEINPSNVKYKKSNNVDGPNYIEAKDNIKWIKYANGLVDTIQADKKTAPLYVSSPARYDRIEKINGRYFFVDSNHVPLSKRTIGINRILIKANYMSQAKNNQDLSRLVKETKKGRTLQAAFGIAGVPPIVIGVGIGLVSYLIRSSSTDPVERDSALNTAYLGFGLATVGVGFEITSIVNGSLKRKKLKQTTEKYNELAVQ
ncbi:MAG: hypothetical protein HY062_17395 [Bacteroidetes bacterium]|nr:hypothetical protein [Bacteroidota bacterium]